MLAAGLGAALLSGCATRPRVVALHPLSASPVAEALPPLVEGGAAAAGAAEAVSLVRYVGADASSWRTRPVSSSQLDPYVGYSDLYTRFTLTQTGNVEEQGLASGAPLRDYSREKRSWLARALAKKTNSVVAVANIAVRDPDLELTVPLYSVSYASGGGVSNQWATALTSSHVQSPLFRIQANSRASIQLSTHVSTKVESRGFSNVLGAVTAAVSIAAPSATLLTKLSDPETNAKAAALDRAVSSLLSSDIVEAVEIGRTVSSWNPGAMVMVTGCSPFVRVEASSQADAGSGCASGPDLDKGRDLPIGRWALSLSCPQFSAFSSRTLCDDDGEFIDVSSIDKRRAELARIAAAATDSEVLSLGMSSQVSLRDYLRGRAWFTAFIAKSAPAAGDFGTLCGDAMEDLQDQGLTGFDSALAVRAMFHSIAEIVTKAGDAPTSAAAAQCRTMLARYAVGL